MSWFGFGSKKKEEKPVEKSEDKKKYPYERLFPVKTMKELQTAFKSTFSSREVKALKSRFDTLIDKDSSKIQPWYKESTCNMFAFLQQPEFSTSAFAPLVCHAILRDNPTVKPTAQSKEESEPKMEEKSDGKLEKKESEPNDEIIEVEFEEGKIGFKFYEQKGKGVFVGKIVAGSQAETKGLQNGYKVLQIGDEEIGNEKTKKQAMKVIKAAARPLKMKFLRPVSVNKIQSESTNEENENVEEENEFYVYGRNIAQIDLHTRITFYQYLLIIQVFSVKASLKIKLDAAFKAFDMDNDGYISEEDLFSSYKQLFSSSSLPDAAIQNIVNSVLSIAVKLEMQNPEDMASIEGHLIPRKYFEYLYDEIGFSDRMTKFF